MATQRHKRYQAGAVEETGDQAMDILVAASIADGPRSTQVNYVSRLKTLAKFLAEQRECPLEDVDATSCTEQEFLQFLLSWKKGGHGDPESFRSALLHYHRRASMDSFCVKAAVVKAVKGAGTKKGSVDKGVLVQAQVDELIGDIENGKIGEFLCTTCKTTWEEVDVLESMVAAVELLKSALVRPGSLKDATENHVYELGGSCWLRVQKDKVTQDVKDVPIPREVYDRLCAKHKGLGGFLFPRCVSKHIDVALERAAAAHGWATGLVLSPMCLRHTAHQGIEGKALGLARAVVHGIMGGASPSVQAQHYCVPLAKRRKAGS